MKTAIVLSVVKFSSAFMRLCGKFISLTLPKVVMITHYVISEVHFPLGENIHSTHLPYINI